VATLSVIRRWALREQMSIREIAYRPVSQHREEGPVSGRRRAAVRQAGELEQARPLCRELSTWLAIEPTKKRKQRRNLRQIHTRRASSTYPHCETFGLTKRVGQYSMEISGQRSAEPTDCCHSHTPNFT